LVSISALWNDYVRNASQFCQILHAAQKCDGFYVWHFENHKPEVDMPF